MSQRDSSDRGVQNGTQLDVSHRPVEGSNGRNSTTTTGQIADVTVTGNVIDSNGSGADCTESNGADTDLISAQTASARVVACNDIGSKSQVGVETYVKQTQPSNNASQVLGDVQSYSTVTSIIDTVGEGRENVENYGRSGGGDTTTAIRTDTLDTGQNTAEMTCAISSPHDADETAVKLIDMNRNGVSNTAPGADTQNAVIETTGSRDTVVDGADMTAVKLISSTVHCAPPSVYAIQTRSSTLGGQDDDDGESPGDNRYTGSCSKGAGREQRLE